MQKATRPIWTTSRRERLANFVARRRGKAIVFCGVLVFTLSSAAYSLEHSTASGSGDQIISHDKISEFVAYAKQENPRASRAIEHASVSDILPDSGIVYYAIPLHFGHPFLRWTRVGSQIVIVDRSTGAVLQVVD